MKILIWAYRYSPASGVGGRRWRKFAKYLANNGHDIWIVVPPEKAQYPVCVDELSDNHRLKVLRVATPIHKLHITLSKKSRFYERLMSKILGCISVRLFGNIDQAEFWVKYSCETVKNLILNNDIPLLIASGHPCSINYWASIIKSDLPELKLIQDFRDTWNDEINYSIEKYKDALRAKTRSVQAENSAIDYADIVLNVSQGQLNRMVGNRSHFRRKFHVLTNGFDPDDYQETEASSPKKIKFIHAGTIRWHAKKGLEEFVYALSDLDEQLDEKMFSVDFYGPIPDLVKDEQTARVIDKYFRFHGVVGVDVVAKEIANATVGLIIFDKKTGYSTKLFDYIALYKNVFAICPSGELSDFCKANNMHTSIYDRDEIRREFIRFLASDSSVRLSENVYESFLLPNIVRKLDFLINELVPSCGNK